MGVITVVSSSSVEEFDTTSESRSPVVDDGSSKTVCSSAPSRFLQWQGRKPPSILMQHKVSVECRGLAVRKSASTWCQTTMVESLGSSSSKCWTQRTRHPRFTRSGHTGQALQMSELENGHVAVPGKSGVFRVLGSGAVECPRSPFKKGFLGFCWTHGEELTRAHMGISQSS